ncbi:hypothetical protein KAU43_09515 [candidate division WOR-3 bacterium]|nr:hypothetical protein [candidate division WOR-3 bacterium]
MSDEIKLFEDGNEEFSKFIIILGNILMLLWIALGTISCWFLSPLIALLYMLFALIMIFVVLRKMVCVNCYYYGKWCAMGWGKLSAIFFRKGDVGKFSSSIGIKLAPVTYGLLTLIPLILIVISLVRGFSIFKVVLLILLLFISFYSGSINRKKTCAKCKMRIICPGSAVK